MAVESNNNQYAIRHDRHGNPHYGVLQIEERVVRDVNAYQSIKHSRKGVHTRRFRFTDMLKVEPSREVFVLYCEMHLGAHSTDKDAAMLLRFGPTGMKRSAGSAEGIEYWTRVEATMESLKPQEAIAR